MNEKPTGSDFHSTQHGWLRENDYLCGFEILKEKLCRFLESFLFQKFIFRLKYSFSVEKSSLY